MGMICHCSLSCILKSRVLVYKRSPICTTKATGWIFFCKNYTNEFVLINSVRKKHGNRIHFLRNFELKRHSVVTFFKLCLCVHIRSTVIAQTSVIRPPLPVEVSQKPLLAVAQIYGKLLVHHISRPYVYCVKILEFIMIFFLRFILVFVNMGLHGIPQVFGDLAKKKKNNCMAL